MKISPMKEKEEVDPRIKAVAEKLKQLRKDKGYKSYETFAWDNDLNRVQYHRMEKGENFTMKSLLKILDVHKLTLRDFFADITV